MILPRLSAKIESEEPSMKIAVLIDADNAQAAHHGKKYFRNLP